MGVLVLHVGAVVHHDLLRRDGIFRRMSPFGGSLMRVLLSILALAFIASPAFAGPQIPGRSIRAQEPHRLHRRADRQAGRRGRIATWTRHDRARSRATSPPRASTSAWTCAAPRPAPRTSTTSCSGPNFLDAAHANRGALHQRPRSAAAATLRGAGQAHHPRRHARRRPALHLPSPTIRTGGRAPRHAASSPSSGSTTASAERMGRHRPTSPTRSRSTSRSWRPRP